MIRVKFLNPSVSVLVPGSPNVHHVADKYHDDRADSANITVTFFNESSVGPSECNVEPFKSMAQVRRFARDEEN